MQNSQIPQTQNMFKVVQLYLGQERTPWIVGRKTGLRFSRLLEDILTEMKIPILKEQVHGEEIPALKNAGHYEVAGLGTCLYAKDTFNFFDTSWDYPVKISD